VEISSDKKPNDNQRSRRTWIYFIFILYFMQQSQMSSYSKFWASSSEITGFLKDSAGDQVVGNVLSGLTLRLGTQGCSGRRSSVPVSESLLTEVDKERWK
jgi:hypothetical protein